MFSPVGIILFCPLASSVAALPAGIVGDQVDMIRGSFFS